MLWYSHVLWPLLWCQQYQETKLSECVGHERQEIQNSDNKEKQIKLMTAAHTKAIFRYLYKHFIWIKRSTWKDCLGFRQLDKKKYNLCSKYITAECI